MKNIILIITSMILVISFNTTKAATQPADTLYLRNRIKQIVDIKQVYPTEIRYQSAGIKTSTIRTVPTKEVAYIVYNNGTKDVFNEFIALKPEINWVTASAYIIQETLTLKACVLNNAQKVSLELNGTAATAGDRGFQPVEDFCKGGTSFSQLIHSNEGQNQAVLVASNEGGETRSAPLTLWYDKAEKRLALVIGNANYALGNRLANPVNDANDVTEALKKMGFEVMAYTDVNHQQMRDAINNFGQRLLTNNYKVSLFYYAGHGVQYQNENYLVPIDAQPKSAGDIQFDCEQADRILVKMGEAKVAANIVLLDACRNNPFDRSFSRGGDEQGLTNMDVPDNTAIVFATGLNHAATDGSGRNGIFTGALLKAMSIPNQKLEDVLKTVGREVRLQTNNQQTPLVLTSMTDDFYFFKK